MGGTQIFSRQALRDAWRLCVFSSQSLCLTNGAFASTVSVFLRGAGNLHRLCICSCIEAHVVPCIWSASNYTRLELFSPLSPICLPLLLHFWLATPSRPMIQISQPPGQFIHLQFPCSQSPRIIHLDGPPCFLPCGRNRIVDDWSRSAYPFPTPALFIYPYALLADSITSQHHFKRFTLAHFRLCLSYDVNTPFCSVNTVIDQVISHLLPVPLIHM